ncbi:MAG: hypothetical protein QNK61_11625 [Akkermansiaceae bacterium]
MGLWCLSWIVNVVESQMFQVLRLTELSEEFQGPDAESSPVEISSLRGWYDKAKMAYAVFPKTTPTIDAAKNALVVNGEPGYRDPDPFEEMSDEDREMFDIPDEYSQVQDDLAERHSLAYTLGTSLTFETIMLALAAWIFCRRDF